jgi:hypothetical protein
MSLTADRRRSLLVAALGFALLDGRAPELGVLHRWLDTWTGVGQTVTGMVRDGYQLHLTNVDTGVWRATFSRSASLAHDGFGAGPTPWKAVQLAAWTALAPREGPGTPARGGRPWTISA